jgi:4-amino-4-deoxy-L-arabinose transferase-like glycosyltransferase
MAGLHYGPVVGRTVLVALIAYCAWVPLQQVLQYPDRLSVLGNLQTDAETYVAIGRDVLEHGSIGVMPPRHPPVWPLVLAMTFALAGVSYVAAKVVLWACFLATIAGCAWLAHRVYGRPAAWAAAVVCACSPAMHGYIGTVQYEVFTGALLVGTLVLAVRTMDARNDRQRLTRAVLAGTAGGILVLTREPFAVVMPIIAVWLAHQMLAFGRRQAIVCAVVVTAIAATPALAWSLAQSIRYQQWITISEKGPHVIELGHNPRANGTYNAPLVGIGQPTGLTYAVENPGREVVLSIRKIFYFWGVLRDGWNVPRPSSVYLWRATTGVVPYEMFGAMARGGWLLVFFGIALVVLGGSGLKRWWGLPAVVLAIMAVHIATLSSHRFAVSTLPVVFALVSGPVAYIVARSVRMLRSPLLLIAAIVLTTIVVLMQLQSWPLSRRLDAATLDGLDADNSRDDLTNSDVRVADAKRGVRPVALLTDEFFARGTLRVRVRARRVSDTNRDEQLAMRISLVAIDGRPACVHDVMAGELVIDRYTAQSVMCELPRDTVASLSIVSLGTVDFALQDVSLDWVR